MKQQGIFMRALAQDAEEAVIDIVGVIGWEVAYSQLVTMIRGLGSGVKRVTFDIYSPGGDVMDGNAIVNAIGELNKTRDTLARVNVAASMATVLAVACKTRVMARNGRWLVHNPWSQVQGDAQEFEKRAKELRDWQTALAAFYAERTGKTTDEMLALMEDERWLAPEEATALGFIQATEDPFKPAEYEGVKAAIVAAGRWPAALAELPAEDPPADPSESEEDKPDEDKPVMVGKCADCGAVQDDPAPPCQKCGGMNVTEVEREQEAEDGANEDPERTEGAGAGIAGGNDGSSGADRAGAAADPSAEQLDGARAEWYARGEAAAQAKLTPQMTVLQAKYDHTEAERRKIQGMYDKAIADASAKAKDFEARIMALTESLRATTARCEKLLAGSLAFSVGVNTWPDALNACGGDYVAARRKYPEEFKAFIAEHKHKKG